MAWPDAAAGGIAIRPAEVSDLEEVERLALAAAPELLDRALHGHSSATQVDVLMRIRTARPDPAANVLVACTPGGDLAGFVRATTAATPKAGLGRRLAALRPLGPVGAVRFLAVALVAFDRHRPAADELYLTGLAVAAPFRRQGLAARLLARIEEDGAARGLRRCTGLIVESNRPSRALFAGLGYGEAPVRLPRWRARLLREPACVLIEKPL